MGGGTGGMYKLQHQLCLLLTKRNKAEKAEDVREEGGIT